MAQTHRPSRQPNADCNAYNAAFHELGFEWSWEQADYEALEPIADEKERIAAWLKAHRAHLLKAYEPGFLVDLIYATKQHCCESSRHTPASTFGTAPRDAV